MVDRQLNEDAGPGHSTWSPRGENPVEFVYPRGRIGRFFAKFFATPAQPKLVGDNYYERQGDAKIDPTREAPNRLARMSSYHSQLPFMPEVELNRKRRYEEYEKMDDYPEVTAAFDIYADESTQKDTEDRRWVIRSESEIVIKEINKLFDKLRLRDVIWDVVRNTVKFGDCFMETIVNLNEPEEGITRLKILNPNYIIRVEDQYGYLEKFLQEIPQQDTLLTSPQVEMGSTKDQYIELDRNQIIHFRLHTSDPKHYPYGKSIAAGAVRIFRSLKLMEEAMIVYRIARAPERRIFYVDVGKLPATRAEAFIEDLKARYKKEKFVANNNVDGRYNPLGPDEDYFIPTYDNGRGTKIETLPGAQNLGEVDDVKYFRDKLLATLKIPKDYIVEFDKSPERKANLAQLDVKFARTIIRVQQSICDGLERIAKRHLKLKEFPQKLINELYIQLPDPSDIFSKRKLELEEAKARVVQAVVGTGLFPTDKIYEQYYEMTPPEITTLKKELEKERKEMNKTQMAQQGAQAGVIGGQLPQAGEPPGGGMAPGTPGEVGAPGQAPLPPEQPQEALQTYLKDKPEVLSLLESYLPRNQNK